MITECFKNVPFIFAILITKQQKLKTQTKHIIDVICFHFVKKKKMQVNRLHKEMQQLSEM